MKEAPLLHLLEYAVYRSLRGGLRALPHTASRRIGRALGALAFTLDRRHHRIAVDNLAAALPELPEGHRRELAGECFRSFGAALCDAVSAARFDAVGLCRQLTLEGWEHVEEAVAAERGTVFLSAHLGSWEIAAYPPGLYGGPLHVVGRPLDNPRLDRELARLRGRFGNRLIPKRGAARGMLRVLQEHGRVGILLDQRVRPAEGIAVPFFGRPALTSPLLARLVLRTGAPVVPVFAYLEPQGRYRFVARAPLWPPAEEPGEGSVAELTASYLAVTEREIRQRPAQWMWMHHRWKDGS
jgi:KDO2-lipid IV(A) lauroyltransferase